MIRITTTRLYPQEGRQHWQVNRAGQKNGPWCIQRATNTGLGLAFDTPKPEHSNFPTRKAAEAFKRENLTICGAPGAIRVWEEKSAIDKR